MKNFAKNLTANAATINAATVLAFVAVLLCAFPTFAADTAPAQVNVNTASTDQLTLLPRVGPALAGRIVNFREENGEFNNVDDLLLVSGIGEKTFALLEAYVKTQGDTTLSSKVRTTDAQARLDQATAEPKKTTASEQDAAPSKEGQENS